MKKFITLVAAAAMTITASAESITASFGAANAVTKDTDATCPGFTLPADYNPGGASKTNVYDGDKGMKARANKGEGGNELMLTVNEGCTITSLTMGMVVNDDKGTFSLAGISVDGTPVADFISVALPNNSNASGAAVVNLSDIKATKDIVFTYDFEGYEGKNKQVFIAGTVIYTEAAAPASFQWEPASLYPMSSMDVTSLYSASSLNFQVYEVEGLASTDVMPAWVDEDGNEVKAVSGGQDDWNPNQFFYQFNSSDFKANGDYTLLFPEGMLVNAAGEKSAKVEIPYTFDIPELAPAMFDDFKILSIEPNLNEAQSIWQNKMFVINTNHNDAIGLTKIVVNDITTGDYIFEATNFTSGRQLGDTAEISFEVVGPFKFFQGHTYRAELTFYNATDEYTENGPAKVVDRVSYEFEGRVEGFKYSDAQLLSISPEPMSMVISNPAQAVFTYTFSAPVSVYKASTPLGQGGMVDYPVSCLSANEDNTVWTLDLSDNDYVKTVDAALTIYIYARDLDGFQLKGDWGDEYDSCFVADWQCDLGAFPIVVTTPAIGEEVDRLSEIVIKAADGEPMSWSWMGEISVVNVLGEVLGTLVYDQPEDVEADSALDEIRFTRWMDDNWTVSDIDLTRGGFYSIMVGPGCFLQGDQFESKQSKSLTSTFAVSGNLEEPEPGIDPAEQEVFNYDRVSPADGSKVESISKIQLWYPEVVATEEFFPEVYNTADNTLVATGFGLFDWDDMNLVNIDFAEPVTAAGTYEVVIPARVIYTENFEDGAAGICNPEIRLTYIVGDGSAVNAVEAADADAVYYDLAGRRVLNPDKGIYIVNGKKVVK